jgi:hypothetical protein
LFAKISGSEFANEEASLKLKRIKGYASFH